MVSMFRELVSYLVSATPKLELSTNHLDQY